MDYPIQVDTDELFFAELWHGGQASALYSLLSTGLIHNPRHVVELNIDLIHIEPMRARIDSTDADEDNGYRALRARIDKLLPDAEIFLDNLPE